MSLPPSILKRFPPSPRKLLDLTRQHMDDAILWGIARADYGYRADEAFGDLQLIRNEGQIPSPMSGAVFEVLQLTRWWRPKQLATSPFTSDSLEWRGALSQLYAAAVLQCAQFESEGGYLECSEEAMLANATVSAGLLGDVFSDALACCLTWHYNGCDDPLLVSIALLVLAVRLHPSGISDADLNDLVMSIWAEDAELSRERRLMAFREPPPIPFGVQYGMWEPVARELEDRAATISDATLREKLRLCVILLDPGW